MIYFVVLGAALLSAVSASEQYTTPVPILKQINKHNEDGSYSYGYEGADGSFKIETKYSNGEVFGKYGYVDDAGKVREVEYGASRRGFEPSGSDINVAPPTSRQQEPIAPLGPNDEDDGQYREDPSVYYQGSYPQQAQQAPTSRYQQPAEQIPTSRYQQPAQEIPTSRYQQPAQQIPTSRYQQPAQQIPTSRYQQPAQEILTSRYQQPAYQAYQSSYTQANYDDQSYDEPEYQQPAYQQPAYKAPVYQPPAHTKPAYQQPYYSPQPTSHSVFNSDFFRSFNSPAPKPYNPAPVNYNNGYSSNSIIRSNPAQNIDLNTGSYSVNYSG